MSEEIPITNSDEYGVYTNFKKSEDFNLSLKSVNTFKNPDGVNVKNVFLGCDVKEFIKRLKEDLFDWVGGVDERIEDCDAIDKIINKLAGKELEDE